MRTPAMAVAPRRAPPRASVAKIIACPFAFVIIQLYHRRYGPSWMIGALTLTVVDASGIVLPKPLFAMQVSVYV